jgi:hypothetical protein
MVDSVQVFDPGFRVTDANGDPVSGAKIKFFETGPGSARAVYSDKDLSNTLGAVVYTRSDGYPVASEGSNTTVLIYTGNTPYYVLITDGNDVAIFPGKDNVRGALDTSAFLESGDASTLEIAGVSKTADYTLVAADNGKCFNLDPSGGAFAVTLTAAATLGDGWWCILRNHASNENAVRLVSSQDISTPHKPSGVRSLSIPKGAGWIVTCNGGSFAISGANSFLTNQVGVIRIADRVAAEPVGPTTGAMYICTGVFGITNSAGASVNTAAGDLIEADGAGNWIQLTPPADCGWLAFVQDENLYYSYQATAWTVLLPAATDAVAGIIEIATAAEMETGTDTTRAVAPGIFHHHKGACKAWAVWSISGGTVTLQDSYNVSSITDGGVGAFTVNFTTPFSSTYYAAAGIPALGADEGCINHATTRTASAYGIITNLAAGSAYDPALVAMSFFGDQ